MVSQSRVDDFIAKWKGASKPELRNRLKTLKTKSKSSQVQAEITAITALLT